MSIQFSEQLVTLVPAGISAFVLSLLVYYVVQICWQATHLGRTVKSATNAISAVDPLTPSDRNAGLTEQAHDSFWSAVEHTEGVARDWLNTIGDDIARYTPPEGRGDFYFVTRPIAETLPVQEATAAIYHWDEHDAAPAILTSLGLFGTFVAILLALLEVSVNPNTNTVVGISGLISGLSGKFLSSVTALLASLIFVWIQRMTNRKVVSQHARLIRALRDRVPYLTPSKILLDIQRQGIQQSVSLSNISSDLVNGFVTTFNEQISPALAGDVATMLREELGPTLSGVDETMKQVVSTVERLEGNKQESVVGELRGLTESMQRAIATALQEMGQQFSDALSGSTKGEFENAGAALANSAEVLQSMNSQFMTMQAALETIIEQARSSTRDQLTAGREQAEGMTRLMEGLMTRLNESAQQNVQGVAGALTAVVNDLSSKVTALSEDLVRTMGDATAQSQRAAGTVVESAAEWSRETTAKLERLLESVGAKSQDFEKASSTMLAAQGMLKETLQENQRALASLAAAASQVKTYSEALAGAGRSLEALQQANVQISTRSAEGVAQLRAAAEKHQAFLEQYRSVFQQSEAAFGQLDQRIAGILEVILKRMGEYNASVENNFREIAKVTNSYVPKMADAFQNQIGALGEQVEDLVEVIEGANRRLRVHVKP